MKKNDLENLKKYVGNIKEYSDIIDEYPIKAMSALLDRDYVYKKDLIVPEGWHWLYFLETPPQNQLGPDGHKRREGFIPPVKLPRRMHAGGSMMFYSPIILGDKIKKVSKIQNIELKTGSTGNLIFLTIEHAFYKEKKKLLVETQNIVFREEKKSSKNKTSLQPTVEKFKYEKIWDPSAEMLFRYSALTFNTHRIHYDYPYATKIEGYENIVVHGPLLATFVLDLVNKVAKVEGKKLFSLSYRVNIPVFVGGKIKVQGIDDIEGFKFWIKDSKGKTALSAKVVFTN